MHDLRFPATPITGDMESFARSATHRSALFILTDEQIFPTRRKLAMAGLIPTVHPAHHRTLTRAGIDNRQRGSWRVPSFVQRGHPYLHTFPHACTRVSITNTITSKPNLHRCSRGQIRTNFGAGSQQSFTVVELTTDHRSHWSLYALMLSTASSQRTRKSRKTAG